jgi:uncharacterized integral membrane protein (TIGR00697 family)
MQARKFNASSVFFVLSTFFIALLVTANLISTKQIELFVWAIPAGAFIFPFNFMLGDVITELFGYKKTRLVIIVGFIVQALVILITVVTIFLPYPDFYTNQDAYEIIFTSVPRVTLASLAAYIFSETINAKIMAAMKHKWSSSPFFARTIGSTLIGQIFDSSIFICIAFLGTMPLEAVLQMIAVQYVVKCATEAVLGTPLAYGLRFWITKHTDLEVVQVDKNPNH